MGRRESKSNRPSAGTSSSGARYGAMFMELEARIAFDGAGAATVERTQDSGPDSGGGEQVQAADRSGQHDIAALSAALEHGHALPEARSASAGRPTEIVFIDGAVKDYETLLAGFGANYEVVLLDTSKDGVAQIAAALAGRHGIDAVHILSHGHAGSLELGTSTLDSLSMAGEHAGALRQIGESLSADADIMVYGCNFGEGARGAVASDMLSRLTGADVAASTDLTGAGGHGGDWVLERETGRIETVVAIDAATQASFATTLNVAVSAGKGAFVVVADRTFYSVDATTGKATAIAVAPNSIGGVEVSNALNSLATDQDNGLIYFTDGATSGTNRALFAYDYVANSFILIDSDLTNNGAGLSIVTGSTGVGGGAAAFANGALYLGVENVTGSDDQIYRLTFGNSGRTIASAATFGNPIDGTNDWGDFALDPANNVLLSLSGTAGATITRYNLSTGAIIDSFAGSAATTQGGGDIAGNTYLVGTSLQQINPVTGALIGTAITITTNGTAPLGAPSDATTYTPQTGTIGDTVYDDNDLNGAFNTGDTGIAGVTVQLIDDVNGNGAIDGGDRILATDTTDAAGKYLFTGVLPGTYLVRVTDAGGVLGAATATTATARAITISRIGGSDLSADFGYDARPPQIDLDGGTPTTIPLTGTASNGDTVSGGTFAGSSSNVLLFAGADNTFSWTFAVNPPLDAPGTRGVLNLSAVDRSFALSVNGNPIYSTAAFIFSGTPSSTQTLLRFADGTLISNPQTANAGGVPRVQVVLTNTGIEFWGTRTATSTVLERLVPSGGTVTPPVFAQGQNSISLVNAGGLFTNVISGTLTVTAPDFDYSTAYIENGSGVSVGGPALGIADPDSTTMGRAVVTLTNAQAGDLLAVAGTLPPGITASIDTGTAGRITLTLSGTASRAAYETAIKQVQFLSSSEAPSTVARLVTVSVDDGGLTSNTATTTIAVTSVNDAPVNTLPAFTTPEDISRQLTGLSIADVDAGLGTMTVTLSVGSGALTAASGGGVTVTGSGTGQIVLSGTLASINAYLASASAPLYVPVPNASGAVTLTMTTSDNGNSGTGGTLTDTDSTTITVTAVNDAPVNTLPAGYAATEDTNLTLTGLAIADIDAGTGTMTVTLSVGSGTLSAASGGSVLVTGSGSGTLVLSGTLASLNAYLASAASAPVYTPAPDANGPVTLTMTTGDGGNTGAGGALNDIDTAVITIAAVNDAPVLDLDATAAGTGYAAAYVENGTGVAIVNANLSVIDVDNANMASASVVIANGQAGDALALAGTLPAGITASYNAATFTLTLTGPASKAAYATALGQVRFLSTSENPSSTPRTVNVSVSDGVLASNVAVATVSVTAVNDAPVNTLPGSYATNEDASVALTGLAIADVDALSGTMTVTLAVNSGTLTAASSGGVVVTGSGSGQIVLSGTLANLNAYLAGGTRPLFVPVADFNGTVTLTMVTGDNGNTGTGTPLTDTDTASIAIAAVADIVGDSATTDEDTAVTIAVLGNDGFANPGRTITAVNGTAIAAGGAVNLAAGTVTLNANGTLTFAPAANYNGTAAFSYTVTSGGVSETASVSVTVNPVDDAPVNAVPATQTIAEDTTLVFSSGAGNAITVTDVDGGNQTVTLTANHGTLMLATLAGLSFTAGDGTNDATMTFTGTLAAINAALDGLRFMPTPDYSGPAQITLQGLGQSSPDTIHLTITGAPDIVADSVSTNEDTAISFNAITGTNGGSADGFANPGRVVTAVTQPPAGQGTVSFAPDGTLTFTPAANYNGTTSFTYTVTSGGVSETATVSVTVIPVNDAPVVTVATPQTLAEDVAKVFSAGNGNAISVADVDNSTLTVTLTATQGVVSLSGVAGLSFVTGDGTADASMTFSGTAAAINAALSGARFNANPDYNGAAAITVQVSDGLAADTETVALTITPVADIAGDSASTAEETAVVIDVLANDSFEDGGRTITAVNGMGIVAGGPAVAVANGTVALSTGGKLVFTPSGFFSGNAGFSYTVTAGGTTETATVNVAIAGVNRPPMNTLPAGFATLEDTGLQLSGLSIADIDAGTGVMTVTLAVDAGTLSATASGTVAVAGSGTATLILSGTVADINAFLASAGRPLFTPAANATANVTLTMTTNDNGNTGGGSMTDIDTSTITITPVNDAPWGSAATVTIEEDTVYTFAAADFGFVDMDDDPANSFAAVVITTVPNNGVLWLAGSPVTAGQVVSVANIANMTFAPAPDANGPGLAGFSFQVRDNGGTANGGVNTDRSPRSFTFDVVAVNDAPVNTLPASFSMNEDSALLLAGLSVADVDAGAGGVRMTLTVDAGTLSATAANGVEVTGSGTGQLVLTGTVADLNAFLAGATAPVFTPSANFNGAVALSMVTSDLGNAGLGGVLGDSDGAVITVAPVNDAPVGATAAIIATEDMVATGRLPVATDVDGDVLTYAAGALAPQHGTVTVNPDGSYTYRPSADFFGTDSFSYTISDGTAVVTYTATVTIAALNDAPVAGSDTASTDADTTATQNLLANDTDVDGDTLVVVEVAGMAGGVGMAVPGSAGGVFTILADGSASFDPAGAFLALAAGETRITSVAYRIADGQGGFADATFSVTVTGVNDAPISTAAIAAQTASDAGVVSFDISGSFADPDSGDVLSYSATGLPTGLSIDPATGVISGTVERSASLGGPFAVTVTASDRNGLSVSQNIVWTVLNPAPVAADDAFATAENDGLSGSVLVDNGGGPDRDPDGDPIAVTAVNGVGVNVAMPVAGSQGGLFTIAADGSYSFVPGTDFDALPAGATRVTTVSYTVSDGEGGFAVATLAVTVTGTNDAPIAGADSFTTNEDTAVVIDVRGNDSDVDGGTLGVTEIDGVAVLAGGAGVRVTGGVVTLNGNGTLTFTPDADYNGTPSFAYTLTDGRGGTARGTVAGTVVAIEDAPVAAGDVVAATEDTPISFDVRLNDLDADGDRLTVTSIDGRGIVAGGTLAVTGGSIRLNGDGTLTFTPNADFNGPASFSYTVSDGRGGSSTAGATINVAAVQDTPRLGADSFIIDEDRPATIAVLANDVDPDGDALTITAIDGTPVIVGGTVRTAKGVVTLNADGTLGFVPDANANGPVSFSYTVSDGQGNASTQTVSGSILPVNDAPVAVADGFTTAEDTPVVIDILANDSDVDGDAISLIQINGASIIVGNTLAVAGGTVRLNADRSLTFTPDADFNGPVGFSYTIFDGNGGTATATVSGTVTPVNDAPNAFADSFTTPEDMAVIIDPLGNDNDIDDDTLVITAIDGRSIAVGGSVAVGHGIVTLNADHTLTFRPEADYNGPISFIYTVFDGTAGVDSSVTGTVTPVNDGPAGGNAAISTVEDTAISGILPVANDVDGDSLTYSPGTTAATSGTVTIAPDGTFTYTPNANFNGSDVFSYVVSDGRGGSSEYSVEVTVTPVNDGPVGMPMPDRLRVDGQTVSFDVAAFFSDVDGDALTFTQIGMPPGLTVSPAGQVSGTIRADASQSGPNGNGVYTVVITATDPSGASTSRSYTVTVTNPAPVAVDDAVVTSEDVPVSFNVLDGTVSGGNADSDPDGDAISLVSASAAHGTVTVAADGTLTYTPDADFNGQDTLTYTITDGQGGIATAMVTVDVVAANDRPVGTAIPDRTRNDGQMETLDAAVFFSDVDGNPLTYSATGLPSGLSIDTQTGLISGLIAPDASGPTGRSVYVITVTASDGATNSDGSPSQASVSFSYTVVNVAPTAVDDMATTAEDTPVDIQVLANDLDLDGDANQVIRVNNVALTVGGSVVTTANGVVALVLDANGQPTLRFTPNANFNGLTSFDYTIEDPEGGEDSATVAITVTPVNDAPVTAGPVSPTTAQDGQRVDTDAAPLFGDVDGDSLAFSATGLPQGLSISAAGRITGRIDPNASQLNGGVYTIVIRATDPSGAFAEQTLQLSVSNPAPTAVNDAVMTLEDTPIAIEVTRNDLDPDSDPLTVVSATAGHGTVSFSGGVITYTPDADFNGGDTILYTISDGNGGFASASVAVTVTAVNDAPTAYPILDMTDSDSETIQFEAGAFFNDVDHDTLRFAANGLPPGLSIDPATGRISGTLPNNASVGGPYTVSIIADDGRQGVTTQTFTWTIVNTPPKAVNDLASTGENQVASGNVLANDLDNDVATLRVTAVNGSVGAVGIVVSGSNGGRFVVRATGGYDFDPGTDFDDLKPGQSRTTTVSYQITDMLGAIDTATVIVTVNGANDAPTSLTIPSYSGVDGQSLDTNPLDVAAFFRDADGDRLTYSATGLPLGLSMDTAGRITGVIDRSASVSSPFTVVVTAFDGTASVSRSFSFAVGNPPPVAVNDSVNTDEDVAVVIDVLDGRFSGGIPDSDPDGDPLHVDAVIPPSAAHGTVVINADGTLTYTPNANFNGTDTITYRISDGQGGFATASVTVTVRPVNDAPVPVPLPTVVRTDGSAGSFSVAGGFADVDGDVLTYVVTGLPAGLTYDAATGVISGMIAADASGPTGSRDYVLQVTASDGRGGTGTNAALLTVVNIAPTAQNDSWNTAEDTPVDIDVLANDRDPDGDTLTITTINGIGIALGGPAVATGNGSIQLVAVGSPARSVLRFTPNANFNGTETLTYTIADGNGGTASASLTVNVSAVNDAPTAVVIPARSGSDGSTVSFNLSNAFADVDGDGLTFSATGLPAGLSINASTGVVSGTINRSASQVGGGLYTVTITASDGTASVPATFVYTVTNPAPVAVNDSVTTAEDTPVTFNPLDGAGTSSGAAGADIDPDRDPLIINAINGTPISAGGSIALAKGVLTLNANGTLTFVPSLNANGTQSFSYGISDGQGGIADAVVSIAITPVGDAPAIDLEPAEPGLDTAVTFTEGEAPVRLAGDPASVLDVEDDIVSLRVTFAGTGLDGASETLRLNGTAVLVPGTAASGTVTFGGTSFLYAYDGAQGLSFRNALGTAVPMPASDLQALVGSIRYANLSENPTAGVRSFAFVAIDSTGLSSPTATARVTVVAVNDAPVTTPLSGYTDEDTSITVVSPGVLVGASDAEGDALTVSAVGGSAGRVGLPVSGSAGGLFTVNANGSYRFDPNGAFEDLRGGETRTTTIGYTVSDGRGGSTTATLTITVTGVNDAPESVDSAVTVLEDRVLTGILPTATDADGEALSYAVATGPAYGTVSISADGRYTYVPLADHNGPDSFTYTVSDGTTSSLFTVNVAITPENDAPAGPAVLPDLALQETAVVSVNLASYFTDVDGDALAFSLVTPLPAGLSLDPATGILSGRVDRSASQVNGGLYTITVRATDPSLQSTSATFTITVTNPAPTAFDDTATTGQGTPIAGSVFADSGRGADTDPDGDPIRVSAVGGSSALVGTPVAGSGGGQFVLRADGSYAFDPGADFIGLATGVTRTTSISYTISDGQGGTANAVLTVTVVGEDDAPVGASVSIVTAEDTAFSGRLPVAMDPDGDTITYGVAGQPAHGTVEVNPDGTFVYTPDANFNSDIGGTDSFTYTVSAGGVTVAYTVSITVAAVNDLPVAVSDSFVVDEDGSVLVPVLANDTDADGDLLAITAIDGRVISPGASVVLTSGTVSLDAIGRLTFTPKADFNGPVSFSYTVSDGKGGTSTGTVAGTVRPVNDVPAAHDDSYATIENQSVSGNVILDASGRDSDPDGDRLTVVSVGAGNGVGSSIAGTLAGGGTGGRFVVNADGTFQFDPGSDFDRLKAGESAVSSVTYRISDGQGGFASATVTVTIAGINDGPTAPSLSTRVDADGAVISFAAGAGFDDADGDELSFAVTGLPDGLDFDPATGMITGRIAADASGPTGTRTYDVVISATDGTETVRRSFAWTVTNPAPVAQNDVIDTPEDIAVSGNVLLDNGNGAVLDPDNDPLTVALVTAPQHGVLTLAPDGSYTYTPAANFHGVDTFVYAVSDGNGGRSTATATITVTPVEDAPVIRPDSFAIAEHGSATIAVLANDMDADPQDTLVVTAIGGVPVAAGQSVAVTGGSVRLNADGTLTFTAAAFFNGASSFTYTVSDGTTSVDGMVNGLVTSVNDAPVNTLPSSFDTDEDTPLQLSGIAVSDIDAGAGAITLTLTVDSGTLAATSAGGVTVLGAGSRQLTLTGTVGAINGYLASAQAPIFSPGADSAAPVTLTMTSADNGNSGAGGPLSATSSAQIIVAPVNDAPTAGNVALATTEDTPVSGTILGRDVDGDALTYSLVQQPFGGTVRLRPDGSFTFMPTPDFVGNVSFDIRVDDGNGGVETARVTVTVAPVNDAPVGSSVAIVVTEDTAVAGALPAAVDVENDPLTYALGTGAQHGLAEVRADGTYAYTPAANFSGTDSFTYTVSDGTTAVPYTVTISVTAVNDAPVAGADSFVLAEDGLATLDVTANDADADGDRLQVTAINGVAIAVGAPVTVYEGTTVSGTVSLNPDGRLTFTAAPNYAGPVTFGYTVSDAAGATALGVVRGTVTSVNDAPVVVSPTVLSATEDTPLAGAITAVDVDGDALTFTLVGSAAHGTVTVLPDGRYTYVPAADFNGPDSFTIAVSDGQGGTTRTTFSIMVAAVADAPLTGPDSFAVPEDGAVTIDVLANDRDGDGDAMTVVAVNGLPIAAGAPVTIPGGTVSLNPDGTLRFVPNRDLNGPVSFTYAARDAAGLIAIGTVSGTVIAVNDAPVVTSPTVLSATEDTPLSGRITASDVDGDPLSFRLAAAPRHGELLLNPDGTYTYTPEANFNGVDRFQVGVMDGAGGMTLLTFDVVVVAVDDAPVVPPKEMTAISGETSTGTLSAFDPDGDRLAFALAQPPARGTLTIDPDGSFSFVAAEGYVGPDSFVYTVSDGVSTVSATVRILIQPSEEETDDEIDAPAPGFVSVGLSSATDRPVRRAEINGEVVQVLGGLGSIDVAMVNGGILDGAVAAIGDLNGVSDMPRYLPLLSTVRAQLDWRESARQLDDFTVEPFLGGSSIEQLQLEDEGTSFIVNTTINEGFLYVMVAASEWRDGARVNIEHRVTLADGRALPDWLSSKGGDIVIGHPPAGLETIALKVQAVGTEGRVVENVINIDVRTGEVTENVRGSEAAMTPAMFSDQMRAELAAIGEGIADLANALRF